MTSRWLRHAALACFVALTGCTGDDDATPTTPASSASTSSPVTSTTAAATTTSTSTTPPATTTTAPPTDEDLVRAAYAAAYDAFWAASQDPDNPELRRKLQTTHAEPSLSFVIEILDQYVVESEFLVMNPDTDDGYDIRSVVVNGNDATVVSCVVNPWLLVRTDAAAAASTIVVNDDVFVSLNEDFYTRSSDGWIRASGSTVQDLSEEGSCEQS